MRTLYTNFKSFKSFKEPKHFYQYFKNSLIYIKLDSLIVFIKIGFFSYFINLHIDAFL